MTQQDTVSNHAQCPHCGIRYGYHTEDCVVFSKADEIASLRQRADAAESQRDAALEALRSVEETAVLFCRGEGGGDPDSWGCMLCGADWETRRVEPEAHAEHCAMREVHAALSSTPSTLRQRERAVIEAARRRREAQELLERGAAELAASYVMRERQREVHKASAALDEALAALSGDRHD